MTNLRIIVLVSLLIAPGAIWPQNYTPKQIDAVKSVALCVEEFETTAQQETCMNSRAELAGFSRESELDVVNNWVIYPVKVDPIDDSESVIVTIQSVESNRNLVISCDANVTYLFLGEHPLLDSDRDKVVSVDTRLDALTPEK